MEVINLFISTRLSVSQGSMGRMGDGGTETGMIVSWRVAAFHQSHGGEINIYLFLNLILCFRAEWWVTERE